MKLGFTGTQHGMTPMQLHTVDNLLIRLRESPDPEDHSDEFHFGDCIGADQEAFAMARARWWYTVSHPPTNESKRAFCPANRTLRKAPYIQRNHEIVDAVDHMLATPKEDHEELRSGTWATIRYARKQGKPLCIVYPSGMHVYERWEKVGSS